MYRQIYRRDLKPEIVQQRYDAEKLGRVIKIELAPKNDIHSKASRPKKRQQGAVNPMAKRLQIGLLITYDALLTECFALTAVCSSTILDMPPAQEIEVKLRVTDLDILARKLRAANLKLITPRTHEMNTLYDSPGGQLRARGEVLRIRKYGEKWTVTHKSKGSIGKHKSRLETETNLEDGEVLADIFEALGLVPSFRYEKYRAEWSDGEGHVVVDETPIGNIAELEGSPEWIDRTAAQLGIKQSEYITLSYAQMFYAWREKTGSKAREMTWAEISNSGR